MKNKEKPIVPVFSGIAKNGTSITGNCFEYNGKRALVYDGTDLISLSIKPETLKISIDGKNFYTMDEVEEALALLRVRNAMIEYDNRLAESDL